MIRGRRANLWLGEVVIPRSKATRDLLLSNQQQILRFAQDDNYVAIRIWVGALSLITIVLVFWMQPS